MASIVKAEIEIEIKSGADKFFNIFRSQAHRIPNICTGKVHTVDVHEGDWEAVGSVKQWAYSLGDDGDAKVLKETVEAVDEENRTATFNVCDGEVLKLYKSFKAHLQVTQKDEGSLVKWVIEYEKQNEDVAAPDAYLEFAVNVTKDIDAHLLNA